MKLTQNVKYGWLIAIGVVVIVVIGAYFIVYGNFLTQAGTGSGGALPDALRYTDQYGNVYNFPASGPAVFYNKSAGSCRITNGVPSGCGLGYNCVQSECTVSDPSSCWGTCQPASVCSKLTKLGQARCKQNQTPRCLWTNGECVTAIQRF